MEDASLSFVLATAGHVDHGKSSLVRALSGIDPDRLPEEKARGITIDLGFADISLPSPPDVAPSMTYHVGIVDVPGHEDFVKNMVAGVGSVDAALLVVAADDGWMPQTEEHLQILLYLGVTRLLVALTKIDTSSDEAHAIEAVRARLRNTPMAAAEIVPTSIVAGRGIDELRAAIARLLATAPPQADIGKPRLAVDRAFSLKGVGTIVTGTLAGGSFHRGESLTVHPRGIRSRARSLQSYQRDVEQVRPGSRVAIQLADVHCAVDGDVAANRVRRGDVITLPNVGRVTRTIDVMLSRSGRISDGTHVSPRAGALRHGSRVMLHFGTASTIARVRLLDTAELAAGEQSLARLTLGQEMLCLVGDRGIIRSSSQLQTLGGIVVLDPSPPRGRAFTFKNGTRQHAALVARVPQTNDFAACVVSQIHRDGVADRPSLLAVLPCTAERLDASVLSAIADGDAIAAGLLLVAPLAWRALQRRAADAVDAHHRDHPEQSGLAMESLRSTLRRRAQPGEPDVRVDPIFRALIDSLCVTEFARRGANLCRQTHRIALPPRLQTAGEQCRQQLSERPFDPPSRKGLCQSDAAVQALKFLIASGEVIDVGPEVVLAAPAFTAAVQKIRSHLAARGTATASELKTLLGTSRRVMMPLLERLDRDGYTRRVGDLRTLGDR